MKRTVWPTTGKFGEKANAALRIVTDLAVERFKSLGDLNCPSARTGNKTMPETATAEKETIPQKRFQGRCEFFIADPPQRKMYPRG